MISLAITKTGRVDLDTPIRVSSISLTSITLYQHMYNLTEPTVFTARSGKRTVIPPGYYTYEKLRELMHNRFKVHETSLKVHYGGTLTGGLKKLIDDNDFLYLMPLALYIHVKEIDTSKNLLDGKRSDLLATIPVGMTNVGEIFKHQPLNNFKRMYEGEVNAVNVSIRDDRGNDYLGKFVAELIFK